MTIRSRYGFKQLSPDQLDERTANCIFCGSTRLFETGITAQQSPRVKYLECQDCCARFLDRQPTEIFLDQYYATDEYSRTLTTSPAKAKRFAQRIISSEVGRDLQASPSAIRILDFGGGNGRLGLTAAEVISQNDYGFTEEVSVVDIYRPTEELGAQFIPASQLFELQAERYNLVIASASLEHVKDPGSVLQALYGACSEGGYLYFRVPSVFPLGKFFQQILLYPEHLSHMNPRFWKLIPRHLGWSGQFVYSRPAAPDDHLKDNPMRYLIASALKLPARIEVSLRRLIRLSSPPRYECAGGWEVLFKKMVSADHQLARD